MKLIRGERGKSQLHELCNIALNESDEVYAAVAYVHDDKYLINPCYERKIQLKLWARYDYTIPVKVSILEWFIGKSPLAICKLIPDIFHPKIIWWKPYGIYIGSANLTDSAWYRNYEAGLFLTEEEIEENDLKEEIEDYFYEIDEASILLTKEIVDDLKKFESNIFFQKQEEFRKKFDDTNSHTCRIPKLEGISNVNIKSKINKKYEAFVEEWNNALQYIRDISSRLIKKENIPVWITYHVSEGVLVDQFLHAYYSNFVKDGNRSCHYELYKKNKKNPEASLNEIINWWAQQETPPEKDNEIIFERASFLKEHLSADKILNITEEDFIQICSKINAFQDYSNRFSYKTVGLEQKLPPMKNKGRVEYLSRRVYKYRNSNGIGILDNLYYLLYSNNKTITDRLFELWTSPNRKIRHVHLSTYGEIIGWALPDQYPPRNGRTSKALKALGYDVKIYTEGKDFTEET